MRPQRQMARPLELDQVEDRHHLLPYREFVEPGGELARAAPTEVVEPIVAVRGDAQLAEPAKQQRRRCRDGHGAEECVIACRQVAIAGKLHAPLRRRRAPRSRVGPGHALGPRAARPLLARAGHSALESFRCARYHDASWRCRQRRQRASAHGPRSSSFHPGGDGTILDLHMAGSELDYSAAGVAVRDDLRAAHRLIWEYIRKPGNWWTGAQR